MILLLIFLAAIICFHVFNKKALGLTLLFIYICDAYGLKVIGQVMINNYNVLFLYLNFFLIIRYNYVKRLVRRDRFARFVMYSYGFFALHMVASFLLHVDNLKETTSILRQFITGFLLYFLFMDTSMEDIKKTLKYCAAVVLVISMLYPLWSMGIAIYDTGDKEVSTDYGRIGMPFAMEFFVIYGLLMFTQRWHSAPYFLPLLGGANRGSIMSVMAGFAWVFRKNLKNAKGIVAICMVGLIIYWAYTAFFFDDFNRNDVSFTDEVLSAIDPRVIFNPQEFVTARGQSFSENGTFSFRIALTMERIIYLLHNPQYLPFGYGMVSEKQGSDIFRFILGTHNEHFRWEYCMVDSNDILWPSYILRFGIAGIVFWVMYFRYAYKTCKELPESKIATVGTIYAVYLVFHSFGTDIPQRFYAQFVMLIVIAYSTKLKSRYKIIDNQK